MLLGIAIMAYIILFILFLFLCRVSGRCSRMEEKIMWMELKERIEKERRKAS